MNKIVIFNVGGAFSSYAEFGDKKIVVDLGSGNEFSPVNNFLLPLIRKDKFRKSPIDQNKYYIDQLFLSHLDNDHVSDYIEFRKYFQPGFMTCPNKNPKQNNDFIINEQLIGEIEDPKQFVLDDMDLRSTNSSDHPYMSENNPLISIVNEVDLYYIKPKDCESNLILKNNYANNISLVLFLKVGAKTLLLPGDIMKEGMEYLINNRQSLSKDFKDLGIDYLVAPHHGLQTAFSEVLFRTILGNKTRLNIISEKVRTDDSDENRSDVDGRYYSSDYSSGDNCLKQNGIKTSMGHIVIDFDEPDIVIRQYQDIRDVLREFV